MSRWQILVGVGGVACLLIAGVLGFASDLFWQAYLAAYVFWVGLSLGSTALAFVQFLTGGMWGFATRRIFEAASATLPLMCLLFLPLLTQLQRVYVWAQPAAVAVDPVLQHKALYLNPPFFIVRALLYLVVWTALALLLMRSSNAQDRAAAAEDAWNALKRLQRLSVVGVMLLGLTVSFAGIDWLMSLDADWYSTMYPPLVAMSFLLSSFAFGILAYIWLATRTDRLRQTLTPQLLNDLGSLLLAFVMLWTYLQYFQYLLIWAGNLSDEIPWYLRRVDGGWLVVAVALAVLGFAVPFWFLLFRAVKRNSRWLSAIAMLLLVMQVVVVRWLVQPPFSPAGPTVSAFDVLIFVGFAGVWLALFAWQLSARPLLAPNDPRGVTVLDIEAHTVAHELA